MFVCVYMILECFRKLTSDYYKKLLFVYRRRKTRKLFYRVIDKIFTISRFACIISGIPFFFPDHSHRGFISKVNILLIF